MPFKEGDKKESEDLINLGKYTTEELRGQLEGVIGTIQRTEAILAGVEGAKREELDKMCAPMLDYARRLKKSAEAELEIREEQEKK